jgi:hypothetical protein
LSRRSSTSARVRISKRVCSQRVITGAGPAPAGQDTVDFVRQSTRRDRARWNTPCDIRPA